MAVLRRETPRVHLPADFGLGLAVAAVIGGLLLLALVMVQGMPSEGPRAESREPDPGAYRDAIAPQSAPSLVPTH